MRDHVQIFHDSLHRCLAAETFLDVFYERFMGSSKDVAAKFAATDFARQKKALAMSLRMMVMAGQDNAAAEPYLSFLAERHSRQYLDIRPAMYGLWLESLLATIREVDEQYDESVEAAWRAVMEPGMQYMIERYCVRRCAGWRDRRTRRNRCGAPWSACAPATLQAPREMRSYRT